MVSTANQQAYGNPNCGTGPPSNGRPWAGPPFWHPAGLSRPVGIVAMILGFVFWWPIGLVLLFLMKWSGHMGCWGQRQRVMGQDGGYQSSPWQAGTWQGWAPWKAGFTQPQTQAAPLSGNHAFDEYRADTLRRLEDEQREFGSFLDRLRFAKDKAEFDQFMAERREHPAPPPNPGEHDGAPRRG